MDRRAGRCWWRGWGRGLVGERAVVLVVRGGNTGNPKSTVNIATSKLGSLVNITTGNWVLQTTNL